MPFVTIVVHVVPLRISGKVSKKKTRKFGFDLFIRQYKQPLPGLMYADHKVLITDSSIELQSLINI